jgi:hypothetical protein
MSWNVEEGSGKSVGRDSERLGKKWEEWERQGNRKVVKGSRKGMGEHR